MIFFSFGTAICVIVGIIALVDLCRQPHGPLSVAFWRRRSLMMTVLGGANLGIALGSLHMYGVNPLLFVSLLGAGAGFYGGYRTRKFADGLDRESFLRSVSQFHVKRKDVEL